MNLNLDLYPTSIEQCLDSYPDALLFLRQWNRQSELLQLTQMQSDSAEYTAYSIAKFIVYVVEQYATGIEK